MEGGWATIDKRPRSSDPKWQHCNWYRGGNIQTAVDTFKNVESHKIQGMVFIWGKKKKVIGCLKTKNKFTLFLQGISIYHTDILAKCHHL